jgi:hypothetical protein
MGIELADNSPIVHADDGSLQIVNGFSRHLTKRDKEALRQKNDNIMGLTLAESQLEQQIKTLDRKIKDLPEVQKKNRLKAKLALVKKQKSEETFRAQGIVEAALSEVTHKSLGEIIEESIPDMPTAKRGRPRKGV